MTDQPLRRAAVLPLAILFSILVTELKAQTPPAAQQGQVSQKELSLTVGKSILMNSPVPIERVAVGLGDLVEATAVGPREVLVNGKAPGETSLIIWQQGGNKMMFDVAVRPSQFLLSGRTDAVRRELQKELPGTAVDFTVENDSVFVRGRVKNLTEAQRAIAIAATLGKPVNLLNVDVPAADSQILLKVRFATVDRNASTELGLNLISTGATNTIGAISTQQFSPSRVERQADGRVAMTLSDALNIFLLRPDLNLAATIRALQRKLLLEILAEPNVLAINGKQASFLAGGEFPFPMLQGGAGGLGQITVQFREFGIRLNFIPTITARGTIRLQVAPEVSALDFSNGLNIQGFQIPALTVRRVNTEVELEAGQSFAIGGLLDNRLTENLQKMPFLGDVPLLGKLFQSKSVSRQNTELLVIVTPELVRPIPAGQPVPEITFPKEFLSPNSKIPMQTPGMDVTGPVPGNSATETLPVETLIESQKPKPALADVKGTSAPSQQPLLFAPTIVSPDTSGTTPTTPAPAASVPLTK